jgi:phosphatidylserine/phosphatidylglycerophosphate/cardiolipin synthase-like enzyme
MKSEFVRVAIPVLRGKRKFHLDKGRAWSVVEHMLLLAVVEKAMTTAEIAEAGGGLPRRLVIEVMIRLMRAGWVELSESADGTKFKASAAGKSAASLNELPSTPKRMSRWMVFVVDRVSGTLYRHRELPFLFEKHVLQERARHEPLVWMQERDIDPDDSVGALISALFADDERFVSMDAAGDRPVDRFALVTVRGDHVDGLPNRAPEELRAQIIAASKLKPSTPAGPKSPAYTPSSFRPEDRSRPAAPRSIYFLAQDLILGGDDHKKAFADAIAKARYRIIIHSTFLDADKFDEWKPTLFAAVRNHGVEVDVLWGQDEDRTEDRKSREAAIRLRHDMEAAGLASNIRIHQFSTVSHGKLLVADNGHADGYFAIVGSCNWLSTGFHSFEASVRLRDPAMVADVLDELAELSKARDGHWTDLTNELARLSHRTRIRPMPNGPRAEAALVLGPQHSHYVHCARDDAKSRIFVTSHRFAASGRATVILPTIAAAKANHIDVSVYYGKPSHGFKGADVARIAADAPAGVAIRPVHEPRLHAKILAWDDDRVLITSQNWLSADPGEANLRREIGVYLRAPSIARQVVDRFELIRRS